MPGGGPASSSRGRGGKFKKYTRGGGHHFSRDLQPVDADGNPVSMWSAGGRQPGEGDDDDDEDDSEEDSSDEDDSDDAGPSAKKPPQAVAEASREDRRAQKKARKEAAIARQKGRNVQVGDLPSDESEDSDEDEDEDDDMPANPNHSKAARKQAAVGEDADGGVEAVTEGVRKMKAPASRRERESLEAQAAKEKYMKLHAAGKTDEAKSDLARLKAIREQREAEAARKQAEKEEKEAQDKARRAEIDAKEAKRREAAAGPKKGKKK